MKKRIFVSMHYMELGGAEISLIGLLQALDYSRYDVDLFIHRHQGELMVFIPKEVNVLPEIPAYACIESPMTEALRRGQLGVTWGRLKARQRALRYQAKDATKTQAAIYQYIAQEVEPHLPSFDHLGIYDLAISFPILPAAVGAAKLVPITAPIKFVPCITPIKGLSLEPPNSRISGFVFAPSRPGPTQL